MTFSAHRLLYHRLFLALVALLVVVGIGTVGFHTIGEGRWDRWQCFYMTVVTISTVGFAEMLPEMNEVAGAQAFTVLLIFMGSGTVLYFASSLTAFVVEGDLVGALRRSRMQKRIDGLSGHVVVCGVGSTGAHVVEEMHATEADFVAIDRDEERIRRLEQQLGGRDILSVTGDATDDETLDRAGVARARGIIASLHDDKDNLFMTITARALNPRARIVAKAVNVSAVSKLRRAGADSVVSPNQIGGLRMASEMIRPQVVEFLELMLRDKDRTMRIEEVAIPPGSPLRGVELRHTNIRQQTDALVIALREADGRFHFNPTSTAVLKEGMTLVIIADRIAHQQLLAGVADGTIGRV